MSLKYSDTRQTFAGRGDARRLSDHGSVSDNWTAKFPAHARPIQHMPEAGSGGVNNQGVWKVYERDYDGKTKPAGFGFRHREQIYRRVPQRDQMGRMTWTTQGTFQNAVAFSS